MTAKKAEPGFIATNPTARHQFTILETIEAGIVLTGTEVKSIRQGGVNLRDTFARIENGQAVLYQCDIAPYDKGNINNHAPRRPRRLLLHRQQINKLFQEVEQRGRTLVALDMHWKNGHVKILLALAQGKTKGDKRQSLKEQQARREIDRMLKNLRR